MKPDPDLLQTTTLYSLAGIGHAFETRTGRLADTLPEPVLRPRQVHGSVVIHVDEETPLGPLSRLPLEQRPPADAMVTARPGVTLAVGTADCMPILLADAEAGVVAAAHAGWRGLAVGVLPATLGVMAREHGARPERCRAAIGPHVSARAYRVGNDVRAAFVAAGIPESVFSDPAGDDDDPSWRCDLAEAARHQLRTCGLRASEIETIDDCTVAEPDRFHSYRRDGDRAGRMLSGICVLE